MDCMKDNTTYVRNIKKYLLAALYNAPTTINSYYSSLVQHDMYGDGQRAVSYTHLDVYKRQVKLSILLSSCLRLLLFTGLSEDKKNSSTDTFSRDTRS